MNENDIRYKVEFSNRKSVGIIIKENGEVLIRAPYGTKKEYIDYVIEKKKKWN